MKTNNYIKIKEFCQHTQIESTFISSLAEEGIVRIEIIDEENCIDEECLSELEMFSRWHYDLGINIEGIDAMRHMVKKMNSITEELNQLRKQLDFYKGSSFLK